MKKVNMIIYDVNDLKYEYFKTEIESLEWDSIRDLEMSVLTESECVAIVKDGKIRILKDKNYVFRSGSVMEIKGDNNEQK